METCDFKIISRMFTLFSSVLYKKSPLIIVIKPVCEVEYNTRGKWGQLLGDCQRNRRFHVNAEFLKC